jgi:hypothetical protein
VQAVVWRWQLPEFMFEISQPSLLIETGRTNGVFSVVIVVGWSVTAECAALGGEEVLPIMKITLHIVKNKLWTAMNVVTAKDRHNQPYKAWMDRALIYIIFHFE